MNYHYPYTKATTIKKSGVNITLYNESSPSNIVYEVTKHGHLEEFYDDVSTYTWFIVEGKGTFVLNDKRIEVGPKDVVVAPPKTRIYYFGNLTMVLMCSPKFNEENAHQIRIVDIKESPYENS